MNTSRLKLSPRMQLFISLALPGMPFWDICCDHGHAGIGAGRSGHFTEIHLVDQLPHVMKNLEDFVYRLDPEYRRCPFYFYSMSGQYIEKIVSGNCLIAGVGGLTMRLILEGLHGAGKLKAQRLILCPHTDEVELVAFLDTQGMKIDYELVERRMIQVGKKLKPLFILNSKV